MTDALLVQRSSLYSDRHQSALSNRASVRFHKAAWIVIILITALGTLTANPLLTPFATAGTDCSSPATVAEG